MKPFYPSDPIADDHLLTLRLTVGDARALIAGLDADHELFRKLSALGQQAMADAEQYLEDRDAGTHCFVTMGTPFDERSPNGYPLSALANGRAKLEHTATGGITDHGRQVACLLRQKSGGGCDDPGDRGWYVYAVESDGADGEYALAKTPYGRIEGLGDRYEVKNPGLPTVHRPDVTTAALTCYLRGKGAAAKKAAKPKAAPKKAVKGGE